MPRPRATDEQRDEQRRRIRQAAREIYDTDGIGAVSVRAIAQRAGTSQGTIYSYFASLGDLLRSLWTEPVAKANVELERIAGEIGDPIERIRALLLAYVDFVLTHPDIHRGALMFLRPLSQPAPDRFPIDDVVFFHLMAEALSEAQAANQTAIDDPRLSAELLWAAIHGALALPFNADIYEVSPAGTLGTAMVDFVIDAIALDPDDH